MNFPSLEGDKGERKNNKSIFSILCSNPMLDLKQKKGFKVPITE